MGLFGNGSVYIGKVKFTPTGRNDSGQVGYKAVGPRGAKFSLIRTNQKPTLMFVVNSKMSIVDLSGHLYFTDAEGELKGV